MFTFLSPSLDSCGAITMTNPIVICVTVREEKRLGGGGGGDFTEFTRVPCVVFGESHYWFERNITHYTYFPDDDSDFPIEKKKLICFTLCFGCLFVCFFTSSSENHAKREEKAVTVCNAKTTHKKTFTMCIS